MKIAGLALHAATVVLLAAIARLLFLIDDNTAWRNQHGPFELRRRS